MMRARVFAVAAVLAAFAFGASANTVMRNGAVYTLDPKHPWATAIVIEDGRIAYAGDDAGARAFEHADSRIVDLAGRMVMPGFHDAHTHPMSAGMRLLRCQLAGFTTADQIYAAVSACAASDTHAWLIGVGWPRAAFGAAGPSRAKLDELVRDRPAYLFTTDGFTAWVNSRALVAGGVDPETVTGVLTGDAIFPVRTKLPRPTEAEYREALHRTTAIANRFGITSVFDASASEPMVNAYHAADTAGELTVRVVAAQLVDTDRGPEQVDEFVARRDRVAGARFHADAAKIFVDGDIPFHTAAMLAPYADAPAERGHLFVASGVLNAIVRRLDAEGFLIHMHVMGDAAVRAGLDAIEDAMHANGPHERRHQLAHVGVVDPADIPRFGKLGVAGNFSPGWFSPDDPALAPSDTALGPARARWVMPIAAVATRGGMIVLSSDWPATSMNPLDGIQWAVTHRPLDGSLPVHLPQERIALAAAIAAYTANAAWVAREDGIDGTIGVGKAADLVVLDRNLFDVDIMQVHNVHVVLTLLDGKPVYRDPAFAW